MSLAFQRTVLIGSLFALWELVPRLGLVDEFFVSRPSLVLGRIWEWLSTGELFTHFLVTAGEAAGGFIIGTGLGTAAGLALGLFVGLSRAFLPLVTVTNALPKLAFAPLLIAWFGFGLSSKVALAASVVFFFIFFAVYSGIRTSDTVLVANARVLGGRGLDMLRHVYLPSALSWIVAGIRLAVAYAFAAAVIGEYLGSSHGLGYLIVYGKEMLNMTDVFAGLVVVMTIVGFLDAGLRRMAAAGSRWRPAANEQAAAT
jgi:NitT/TauT family transport system permease protein